MVIHAEPRADGALSVLSVDWKKKLIVLSTGEEVYTPFEKLMTLASELCQEQAPVTVRLWATRDGTELIELHRCFGPVVSSSTTLRSEEIF